MMGHGTFSRVKRELQVLPLNETKVNVLNLKGNEKQPVPQQKLWPLNLSALNASGIE